MKKTILFISAIMIAMSGIGQNFELPKTDGEEFEEVKVSLGADFALQLQGLNHEAPNVAAGTQLVAMPHNFNLPTANMGIKAELASGITLHMNTFLSARHHNEAWVEGGYMIIDRLPFLPATDNLMKFMTIKAGVMSPNYGDSHFYRSNNAAVLNNPFVGNWIMDNYTTNPGVEVMYRNNGIIAMVGTNNGRLNYGRGNSFVEDMVFNWKVGYDKALNDDLRVRATVSGYHVPDGHSGSYLWGGDRAGARYYDVMDTISGMNFRSGRFDPASGQSKMMAVQGGLFVQYKGLDVFGFYETMSGIRRGSEQNFSQMGAQVKYTYKTVFLASRYNVVNDVINGSTVNRMNVGLGWMMTENVVMKLDYVTQTYNGASLGYLDQGGFKGLVFEAGISF